MSYVKYGKLCQDSWFICLFASLEGASASKATWAYLLFPGKVAMLQNQVRFTNMQRHTQQDNLPKISKVIIKTVTIMTKGKTDHGIGFQICY
jgi:hypothetical protein